MSESVDFSWVKQAACQGENTEQFFPTRGEELLGVLALCAVCPVRAECLAYALEHESFGVWGGTSERQRRRIRHRSGIRLRPAPSVDDVVREMRNDVVEEAS